MPLQRDIGANVVQRGRALAELLQPDIPLGNGQVEAPDGSNPRNLWRAHQCHLVSCSGSKRWVISAYWLPSERRFSLAELSQLKSLSSTLLPLVEHHGQLLGHDGAEVIGQALDDAEVGRLQQAFGRRLLQASVKLSVREQEVCVGLLGGCTVPELAQRLNVKNSSVETYLKRAAAKLGVSGRNGLTKWMTGASDLLIRVCAYRARV
ncbi:helix-turn-helix transcriptional regulator [Pseudomonas putida]|nr:helix-turn-helix transcriptional regulator [Pseudomonas putida]